MTTIDEYYMQKMAGKVKPSAKIIPMASYAEMARNYARELDDLPNNPELSPNERERRYTELQASIVNMLGTVAQDARREYEQVLGSFDGVGDGVKAAYREQADQWDYSRLIYARDAVRARIAEANDLHDLEAAYKEAQDMGDNYALRAWGDFGPSLVKAKVPDDVQAGGFAQKLRDEAGRLLDSPKVQEARQAEGQAAEKALAFKENALFVSNFVNQHGDTMAAYKLEVLASGIKQRINSGGKEYSTTVDVADISTLS